MGSYFNVPRKYRGSGKTIRDYLFDVENTQHNSPVVQILGWGYSETPHTPVKPTVDEIPTWMSPDYPFVNPPDDIRGFIVDTLLSFDNPLENIEAPIKLERITKHSSGVYSVRFTDANGNVVFDSSAYSYNVDSINLDGDTYIEKATNQSGSCVYKHKEWGTYYELLYWETELVTLKMIIRKTTIDQFALYPDMAELDARALYQYPKRVRSITIESDNEWKENDLLAPYLIPNTHGVITGGHIQIWEGYNMKFDWSDNSSMRTSHIITLSATRGAGEGVAQLECPKEEPKLLVTSINGIEPTEDGAFFIKTDACHTVKGETAIQLANDCKPCCECKDMTKLAKLLKQIEDEYYCIGGKYQVCVGLLLEEIEALEDRIAEEDSLGNVIEYIVEEGNRLFLKFRFIFRNRTKTCLPNLTIKFTADHADSMTMYKGVQAVAMDKNYADCTEVDESPMYVTPAKSGKVHTVTWDDKIAPGQQIYLKGLWRLNTTYSSYTNQLTEVSYYDSENEQKVYLDLGTAGIQHRFPATGVYPRSLRDVFDDFTSSDYINVNEVNDLEMEVREICMAETQPNWREDSSSEVPLDYLETRNIDKSTGNAISDSDLIEKHSFYPKPDYYKQRDPNNQ